MAREAVEEGADLVVSAGGDGTVHETVNGIQSVAAERGAEWRPPRMAIVPSGTANDLAGALGIPADSAGAVEVALNGRVMECDVGMVEDRFFLNVSTGGIGAEATEEAPDDLKRILGRFAYLVTGVEKFIALETSNARFVAGSVVYQGPFLLFAVGNSRQTGGGNLLTPRAHMADGLLDLCVVGEMSRLEFARMLPELRAGRHVDHPSVVYRQVPEVRVESEVTLSVNADGEPLTGSTFHYRIAPVRIPLMIPADPPAAGS